MHVRKIKVSGYQSLYNVSLDLGRFTVIYGESDVGKSAFYRAVRGFITTEVGDDFISRGETKCSVSLELASGRTLTWTKRKGESSEYALDSRIYRRAKQMPTEIAQALKIAPIGVDGERFYPNLRGQFDHLFLLFDSSNKRARVLGSLISNILLQGIKQANIERNRNEADIRAMSDLILDLEKRQNFKWDEFALKIKAFKEVVTRVLGVKKLYIRLVGLDKQKQKLEQTIKTTFEVLPVGMLAETTKLRTSYDTLKNAMSNRESLVGNVVWINNETKKVTQLAKDLMAEIDGARREMMLTCPFCRKEIPLYEVLK